MATSEQEDYDDEMPTSEPPVLRPLDDGEAVPRTIRRAERNPGFGFWLAVGWSILYLVVSQIVAGVIFAIIIFGIALIPEIRENGLQRVGDPIWLNAWMIGPDGRIATLLLVSATQFSGLLLSLLLLRIWCGKPWKRKIALTRLPSRTHCLLVLLGFPAMIALGEAVTIPITHFVPSTQDVLDALNAPFKYEGSETLIPLLKFSPLLLAIFAVAISPGICEEMFCRGFLAQGLAGRYRTWMVVLITSFLFGCLHMDLRQGLGAAILGAAIHGAYLATRSMLVAMFVHLANNGLAVLHFNDGFAFPLLSPFTETLEKSPVLFVSSAMCFFAAIIYAFHQTRCKLAPLEPGMPVWVPKGVSSIELPPPNSGTVVVHDPISTLSVLLVLAGAIAFGLVMAFV